MTNSQQGQDPWYQSFLDRNLLPDWLIRTGIRRLLASRLRDERQKHDRKKGAYHSKIIQEMNQSPIVLNTNLPNRQHYDVPVEFFRRVLGKWLKYSCGYWSNGVETLEEAEEAMLKLTCQRARITDGQKILDLGCGWGSLSLFLAKLYPTCQITAISNSASQKEFIDGRSAGLGIRNLRVLAKNIADFETDMKFDRILSIEMFEHMRNYRQLLARIASWMKDDSLLFIHIFCHTKFAYFFEDHSPDDWMARNFFTGGMMPSVDLLHYFQDDVRIIRRWRVNGIHYHKTLEAWLRNHVRSRHEMMPLFTRIYGRSNAQRKWVQWRVFFLACSELFRCHGGREWIVSHYLLQKRLW
ncbi:class I SAM-dependent methyltransferase [candidate division KSB1 bacterium]|nr:class I SAM-dependent methyltransferase [candidate division KSB1 bacterium]NIR69882.1 class I SAM-dependent methyltransferase [candidate division KSB1 bacterium]NIS28035.1 class I SAM-dependent methyltransferase [candidate division KSB1 bacterium]NIT74906.1 class I SAM-dependent methyltransferase [candidate division KSB1 bacterium]NIU28690.1 class I SAM-dependent methyltransferase [candidate division KSB1 bacterium]